jgi:hypothetical protein
MFWRRTRIALFCSLLVLTWVLGSQSAPISFTSTYYEAYASAYYGWESEEFKKTSPGPVSANASVPNASAAAGASGDTQLTGLCASASASSTDAYAYSYMVATFEFEATFPQIRISYDYEVKLTATGDEVIAYGGFYVYLEDWSAGGAPFVHVLEENGKGRLNELIDLSSGHEYYLWLGTDLLRAEIYDNDGTWASASVSLTNIDIQAVPLPASLLLVGSGLLALWARKRKYLS